MKITVVYPDRSHSAYKIAAETFASLAYDIAGVCASIVTDDQYLNLSSPQEVTVLIGNDAVNHVISALYLSGKLNDFGIRYGTDDYCIRTAQIEGSTLLFLAGGRPRATIYAVYRYFEQFCGCRWFWDGDRLSKTTLPLSDIDLTESPRFAYRGLRYFAHRSLHRFQAEHWSLEDWEREIDWMLKKRLNLFMLRIGMDDLFQKAFPDVVSYPERDKTLPEAGAGYDDRTLFWSLEYRGELRKKILNYAFERDLMHPEDCGTVSHWYSRTPKEFLDKVKPSLLPQSTTSYGDPTGRVWDIRERKNFDNYFKLSEAHIREYGKPELFHTIGLGERLYSADPEENKRMKLYVYRMIATRLKEQYPNAPLLVASWDLWMRFTPEEVRQLVAELDPSQSIILDYTSDTTRDNNFTEWGVINRFPWIFGIFSGYEPNSEIRGYYELTNERIRIAKDDPMCCGMILWPELSHGDPFVIEYFARNAWDKDTETVAEQTDRYCYDRYPSPLVSEMCALWHDFMPIVQLSAWSIDNTFQQTGNDIFVRITERATFNKKNINLYPRMASRAMELKDTAVQLLRRLTKLPTNDGMTRRDVYDIARTILGRYINTAILIVETLFARNVPAEELEAAMQAAVGLMEALADLLGSHDDYSLLATLTRLQSVTETNPNFEQTLKNNAECGYCRAYIYENAAYLYLPEMKAQFEQVKKAAETGQLFDKTTVESDVATIRRRYFETPLSEMKQAPVSPTEAMLRAAKWIEALSL